VYPGVDVVTIHAGEWSTDSHVPSGSTAARLPRAAALTVRNCDLAWPPPDVRRRSWVLTYGTVSIA